MSTIGSLFITYNILNVDLLIIRLFLTSPTVNHIAQTINLNQRRIEVNTIYSDE